MNKIFIAVLLGAATLFRTSCGMEADPVDRYTTNNNYYYNNRNAPWEIEIAQGDLSDLNTQQQNNGNNPVLINNARRSPFPSFYNPNISCHYYGIFDTYYFNGQYYHYLKGYEPANKHLLRQEDQSPLATRWKLYIRNIQRGMWEQHREKMMLCFAGVVCMAAVMSLFVS